MKLLEGITTVIHNLSKYDAAVNKGLSVVDDLIDTFAQQGQNPRMSAPVKEIKTMLDTYKVSYEMEKTFADCRNVRKLPFDFCIYTNNKFILIEYNGKQHYEPCFGLNESQKLDNYNHTKHNDSIKQQYCKDHRIKLYTIAYNENHLDKMFAILKQHHLV